MDNLSEDEERFPSLDDLVRSAVPASRPAQQETVAKWLTLSPQLQSIVPHVAELTVTAMGGRDHWRDMTSAERNIFTYGIVALLAEAQKRASSYG